MSLLLKAALAANLPPPKPEDFTGYQVTGIMIGILVIVIVIGIHVTTIVIGILVIVIVDQIVFLIDCPKVFSLTPHSPSQVDWLLELR